MDTSVDEELCESSSGSSSTSFLRSIPLQQLRALVVSAAQQEGGHTRTMATTPHLRSRTSNHNVTTSSPVAGGGCSTDEKKKRRQHEDDRVAHQQPPSKEICTSWFPRDRVTSKSSTARRFCSSKLPVEVSCRHPHYARGQPLVCASVVQPSCVDEVFPSPIRVGRTAFRSGAASSRSLQDGPVGGSSNGSQNRTGFVGDSLCESPVCGRLQYLVRQTQPLDKISSSSRNGDAEKKSESPASSRDFKSSSVVSTGRTIYTTNRAGEQVVGGARRELPAKEQVLVRDAASCPGRVTAEDVGRSSQQKEGREAALQRRLKSLRSMRVRLANGRGESVAGARGHSWRIGREARDPRFSEACGPLDLKMVGKAYAFLDDMRKREAEQLQRLVKKGGRPAQVTAGVATAILGETKGGLQSGHWVPEKLAAQKALQRLRSQDEARKRKGVELAVKGQLAREEKARIAQTGKKPYFVSRKIVNRLIQAEWQKRRHGAAPWGQRRAAKQEEKKARNHVAKERRRNLLPVRRFIVEPRFGDD